MGESSRIAKVARIPRAPGTPGVRPWGALLLVVATLVLSILRGAPHPSPDDIFFVGAAMNLAQGGALENPFIREFMKGFHTEAFLVQPPLHSWTRSPAG